jgi:hypothetical protein
MNRLKDATKDVKSQIVDQNQAIRTLHQAYRDNNFQLLENIRVLRSFHSLAVDINQVIQTQILQSIQNTQKQMQQEQVYSDLAKEITNVTSALNVLGGGNTEVQSAFDDIASKADQLSSTDIQKLIDQIELLKKTTNLTPDELAALDSFETKLQAIEKLNLQKEQVQQWQNFMTTFSTAALTASSVGNLAAQLKLSQSALSGLMGVVSASLPEITIIILLLFGKDVATQLGLLQDTGDFAINKVKMEDINPATGKPFNIQDFKAGPGGIVPDVGPKGGDINIQMNFSDVKLDPNYDVAGLGQALADAIQQRKALEAK